MVAEAGANAKMDPLAGRHLERRGASFWARKNGPYPKAKMGTVLSPSTALPSTTSTCGCCPLWRMQWAQTASPLADVKGKRSRRRGGREVNYDTYAFDLCGPCVRSSHGQAVEPLGGGRRGNAGDGKRSSRCGGEEGRSSCCGVGGLPVAWGLGSGAKFFKPPSRSSSRSTPRTLRAASARPARRKNGRGAEGGRAQAESMRACVSTYNCACMRVCGVHLCFW